MSKIKRSISLYSLQDDYANKRLSLEDIFKKTVEWDIEGIELISDQMIHKSPYPTEETLAMWKRLVRQYGRKLVCNDIFINSTLFRNRKLTLPEQVELLKAEIINAHNLGFDLVRLVSDTEAGLIEPALETAEKYNVTMALEIHAGMSFHSVKTREYLEVMKKLNSSFAGIVVDLGIFCTKHPRVSTQYFKQFGLNPELADYIDDIFVRGSDPLRYFGRLNGEQTPYPEEFQRLLKNPIDIEYARFAEGYENTPYEELDEYMPYLKHIHGKCYEMTEDNEEYSIPYGEIIKYLDAKNYDGYISTEYEGNRFVLLDRKVDSIQNVQRHQQMLKKYIGR